ncbi:hypothetical protein Mgra_00008707 [Meloidogyne graminicola]|jgi:hypothetical protein
MLKLL